MNNASHGFRFDPQDLRDPRAAVEALAHWDELAPEALSLLAHHPVHGPRLAMLRAADSWLESQAALAREARGSCPNPEALYDFGRGPGYTPLTHAARAVIDHHLSHCRECELLVESLVAPPPAPLELDYVEAAHESESDSGPHSIELEPTGAGFANGIAAHDAKRNLKAPAASDVLANRLHDSKSPVLHDANTNRAQEAKKPVTHEANANGARGAIANGAREARASGAAKTNAAHDTQLSAAHDASTNGASDRRAKQVADASSDPATVHDPKTEFAERVHAARNRSMRRWVPMAAAASLLVAASVWTVVNSAQHPALRFPESPLLRGSATGSLLFPRDRVLHATPDLEKIWPAFGERLTFEIQATANAESYWFDVSKHDGSAFSPNTPLWKQSGKASTLSALSPLEPGHYTWEAWAIVRGLDQQLGARDFEVVDDAALRTKLFALEKKSEPERTLEAVRLLHESGYATDARRLARSMPSTPERDAYLEQVPGR